MDQELKQRLIGAAVVTALAAIFIPMLFDDPIDDSGQMVSELNIPPSPSIALDGEGNRLPTRASDVVSGNETAGTASDSQGPGQSLPLQSSEKIDRDEAGMEEFVVSDDEPLQWTEANADDSGSDTIPEDSGLVPGDADQASADIAQQETGPSSGGKAPVDQHKPLKSTRTASGSNQSSQSPPMPTASVPKPKTNTSGSKARLVRWYVQAGSFSKKENALSRQKALRQQGMPVFIETQATDKGTFYRLKIGPELDKKRAIAIRDRLGKQNIQTIVLAE
ncbi:MAG: SPOR domain-containing protein [Gammaproteobacteria bacterium]